MSAVGSEEGIHPRLRDHFQDLGRQTHAARLGMWLVVISEVLLFGGLFALYGSYRAAHAAGFRAAAGETALALGTLMTYLLIVSSLFVALAVQAIRRGAGRRAAAWLGWAAVLGVVFLGLKGWEYASHLRAGLAPGIYYDHPALEGGGPKLFFTLYYLMTGLHALHVAVGVGLLLSLAVLARRGRFDAAYHTPVELGGMYWHLVDAVWVFLWPLFYLLR
ncbi:MAG: cytochrome c oxidase subunit 3 [Myxococcota bacterium]